MRSLRVLHLAANRWWTGSADPVITLVRGLRERGHRVLLGCIRGDRLEATARGEGLPLVERLSLDRTAHPFRLARDLVVLRRLIRSEGIEIVHTHLSHDHWLAGLARGGAPARLLRTFHRAAAVKADPLHRWLYRRTDAAIAVAGPIERRLAAVFPADRRHRIGGAVDLARFPPGLDGRAIRAELGLGEAPVVGTVGRLVPGRGHDLLIGAFARLRGRLPVARLLIVGKGEGRPGLEAEIRRLGLEDAARFAGYREADLPAALAAMDCFVLLGAGSEESCRAALEAMAAGRPVLAARAGALPETVVDGETGWLVEGRDPEAVAARIETLLTDPEGARRMGAAGRQRVEAAFAPARQAARVEAIYRDLLGEGR